MLPRLPLASYVDSAIDVLVEHFSGVTRAGSDIMLSLLDRFEEALLLPPPWLFILLLTALAWRVTRRPGLPGEGGGDMVAEALSPPSPFAAALGEVVGGSDCQLTGVIARLHLPLRQVPRLD